MTILLDDRLLVEFMQTFYGYGDFGGRFWFVGMEEGGGDSAEVIQRRLDAWSRRGKLELEDLPNTAAEMGANKWFNERPRLQRTWSMLIRIALASEGGIPTTHQVREYQKGSIGRHAGDNCLLELLPLPSPSLRHWIYRECSQLDYLETRERYRNELIAERIAHLKQRIAEHKPNVVVFYGLAYSRYWQQIAESSIEMQGDAFCGHNDHTLFVITKHPAAKGVTKEYFHQVGKQIGEMIRTRKGSQPVPMVS